MRSDDQSCLSPDLESSSYLARALSHMKGGQQNTQREGT